MGGPNGGIKEKGTNQTQSGKRKSKTLLEEDKKSWKGKSLTTKVNPDVHLIIQQIMAPILNNRRQVQLHVLQRSSTLVNRCYNGFNIKTTLWHVSNGSWEFVQQNVSIITQERKK